MLISELLKRKNIILFVSLLMLFPVLSGCSTKGSDTKACQKTGFYFDTVIGITVYSSDFMAEDDSFFERNKKADERCKAFLDDCFLIADHYEKLLSKTRKESDIYKINNANANACKVDDDTAYLLEKAVYYAELSDGAFDPTIGSVSDLWDFAADSHKDLPDIETLSSAVSHVNYKNIILKKKSDGYYASLSDPQARIDLGGIAKGFIADKIKELFMERNIKSGIINLGGNVLLIGNNPVGSAASDFKVGIQKPFGDAGDTSCVLSLSDKSVVTSGIYDRYFMKDDIIYHHILDTKTGYPVQNDIYSATIVSASSVDGDALSTICLSLGAEKGMELIDSIPDTFVLFIKDDYEIVCSDGFPIDKDKLKH